MPRKVEKGCWVLEKSRLRCEEQERGQLAGWMGSSLLFYDYPPLPSRASHVQLFWIFMLFQAVNTVKLNFKAGLFSLTFQFEHSFLAKSQC